MTTIVAYFSGCCCDTEKERLHLIDELFLKNQNVILIGSSGGALLASFFALGLDDDISKQEFFYFYHSFQNLTLTWHKKYNMLKDWIKSLTGGGLCTIRQWRARATRDFAMIVYDYKLHHPILINSSSNWCIADVLIGANFRETPSFHVPKIIPNPWVDVENIIPSSILCSSLKPIPIIHFKTASSCEMKRPENTKSDAQILVDVYDVMLSKPATSLTMTFHQSSFPESGLAVFDPYRWFHGLITRSTSDNSQQKKPYIVFVSLSLLTWYIVSFFFTKLSEKYQNILTEFSKSDVEKILSENTSVED